MAIDTGIESYILNQIALLDNNTISADDLIRDLLLKLQTDYNISETADLRKRITDIVSSYSNHTISSSDFVTLFKETVTYYSNNQQGNGYSGGGSSGGGVSKIKKKDETQAEETGTIDIVVDADINMVQDIATQLIGLESEIESIKITVPTKAQGYDTGIGLAVELAKQSASGFIDQIKAAMEEVRTNVVALDEGNEEDSFITKTFEDIASIAYDIKQNSLATRAGAEFFQNCKIEGDFAILTIDGKECKYDMKNNKFYAGNSVINATIYIPSNINYSKLDKYNTYTYFVSSDEKYVHEIESKSTNSILIQIQKNNGEVYTHPWTKFNETALMTKFVNKTAQTDLASGDCQNIIGGDSAYGTYALKTAGQNKGLYQTAYCIDNAIIATDVNNSGRNKQQMTQQEVKNLDGMEIYFFNVAGDSNLYQGQYNNNATSDKGCNYSNGYTYTGIDYLLEVCPNTKAYMIYPGNSAKGQTKLGSNQMGAYRLLEKKYSGRFTYDPDHWTQYFDKEDYETHTSGNYLPMVLASSGLTNYNNYNA